MTYKTLSIAFFIAIQSVHLSLASTKISQSPIPSWVKQAPIPPTNSIEERDITDGYHYLLLEEQVQVELQSSYRHAALYIVNDVGVQNASEIEITYDPSYESLSVHFINVIRNGLVIQKLNLKDIKTLQRETDLENRIYDGRLSAYINLKDIRKGDIIDYAFSRKGRNPVYGGHFFEDFATEYSFPVTKIFYRLIHSSSLKLQAKQHTTNFQPQITTEGNNKVTEWTISCLKPKDIEESTPIWFNPLGFIEVSTFQSWEEVANWAVKLYNINDPLTAALKHKIAELNSGSDETKILSTFHFVQDEIRYMGFEVGINSHKPNSPNKVFTQRFGDCKDKALLMCSMLHEMGIEAYPNLVNTNKTKALANWIPSPGSFNHVTVCVVLNNTQYWLDPTDSHQAGKLNTLQYPQYAQTLLIKPNETGLTTIEDHSIRKIKVYETFVVQDTIAPITLRVVTTCEGKEADNMRYLFSSRGMGEIEKDYVRYYQSIYGDVSMVDQIQTSDDTENNIFKLYEEYTIKDLWTIEEGRKQIVVGPYLLFNAIASEKIKTRKMPYALRYPFDYQQILEVKFPKAIEITNESETVSDDHFNYTYHFKNEGGLSIVSLDYHFKTLKDEVAPEDAYAFFTKIEDLKRINTYYLSWGSDSSTLVQDPTLTINWVMVLIMLVSVIGFILLSFHLFKKDVEPKHEAAYAQEIGGWVIFVGISIVLGLLLNTYQLFSNGYFNQQGWTALTTPGREMYHPLWGIFLIGELVFIVGMVVFAVLLLLLFKDRRSSFPRMFIQFIIYTIVFRLFEDILISFMPNTESLREDAISASIKVAIYAAIWIPYMLTSWRVRETFVFTYDPLLQKTLSTENESAETTELPSE
jgi:transglutaminase-like putative cysteine protease